MEKITINSIEERKTKTNVPFWSVETNRGKMTVWDEAIATTISTNINVECEAELKTVNNFTNIRAFVGKPKMTSDNPAFNDPVKETKTAPNPQRVGLFIKLAVEMMIASPQEGKNIEENLCENIQEIKKLEEFTINLLG